MITFGGAYAVLPYVSQQAVETHAWLTAGQMLDGLGLAESTPGPLIMVLPEPRTVDWFALTLAAVAFAGILRWKWDIIPVIIAAGLLGLLYRGLLGL